MTELSTRTLTRPRSATGAVRVVVVAGPSAGAAAVGRKVTVGRSRTADIAVTDHTVSEFHIELSATEGGIEARDLESYNGSYFEGARVHRIEVPRGALLSIGESTIQVDIASDQAESLPVRDTFRGIIGKSTIMRELFALLERLAATDLAVFIEGPTGSGKELVARALHDEGPRANGPFVVLDCAALPASLAESVLFGHAPGAFTGATEQRMGVFEAASGGTVFLDEVGDLPLDLQPKLLRVLEQRQIIRLGENKPRPVNVRVLSATWRELRRMVNQGLFRDDVYYRLAQARVVIPSLNERREDIEPIALDVLRRLPRDAAAARGLSRDALSALTGRDWTGNVRELRNVIERAAYMCDGPVIRPPDLAFERMLERHHRDDRSAVVDGNGEVAEFKDAKRTAVDDFEREYLVRLMTKTNNHIATAAGLAGIERHYLRALLKKHGLYVPNTRD